MTPLLRVSTSFRFAVLVLGAMSGGCAATSGPSLDSAQLAQNEQAPPEDTCGRITGRMQIRILSLRNEANRSTTSSASRGLRSFTSSLGGAEGTSDAPSGRQARELADLNDLNGKLKAMGCKTFDVDAEVNKPASAETPRPG